jgi:nucleotide-binding universal stress UspA family protein
MTTFMVGVDGSEGAKRAAAFAAKRARAEGARLVVAHIVDWSPYEFLTPEELSERPVEMKEEIEEAMAGILRPLEAEIGGEGLELELVVKHGHPSERLCEYAERQQVDQVFTGRRGRSRMRSLLFGSVSGSLVQMCPVPITVVP